MRDTPLMRAARSNCPKAVELLIAAGAEVNAKNPYGETALGLTEQSEYESVVRILKRAGAKK